MTPLFLGDEPSTSSRLVSSGLPYQAISKPPLVTVLWFDLRYRPMENLCRIDRAHKGKLEGLLFYNGRQEGAARIDSHSEDEPFGDK